jgi:glycosyltransferase involved in cell wall biosynthesis
MAFLSVVIPTFNSELTIEKCLESLVCQTFQDFEICIIDAASSDETVGRVNQFRPKFQNIRILSESDRGTYDAMNKGIDLAKGEWVYFIGSDDEMYDENVFSDVFKVIPEKKCGIVYGNVYVNGDTSWAKDGQIYDGEFTIEHLLESNICHQSIFYRKTLFDKLGKYNLAYSICADWELNIRFFPRTSFKYIDKIIAKFHGGGISSQGLQDDIDPLRRDLSFLRKKALLEHNIYKFMMNIGFT